MKLTKVILRSPGIIFSFAHLTSSCEAVDKVDSVWQSSFQRSEKFISTAAFQRVQNGIFYESALNQQPTGSVSQVEGLNKTMEYNDDLRVRVIL